MNTRQNDYAGTAYSAQIWKTQPQSKPHRLSGMFPLPFGDYRNVDPDMYLYDTHEIIHAAPPSEEEKALPLRFDAQKIRTITSSRVFVYTNFFHNGWLRLADRGGDFW